MTVDEIWSCVEKAVAFGYGTVVLQAGEDSGLHFEVIGDLVRKIKEETDLAVTLSLGEQTLETLKYWKTAGADRYLLRIETTDEALINKIHPGQPHGSRMENIYRLRDLGYQVGSGIMVGIPGQTYRIIAQDLGWFHAMDLDMIGIGPYLSHPDTPLANETSLLPDQVPNTEIMTHKVVALARLLCPEANIPATTALATVNRENGREQALLRGANVVMPNLTPAQYRKYYEIYPNKACVSETEEICQNCMSGRIVSLGRAIGSGPGHRRHLQGNATPTLS
jgi:biotin synthase